LVEASAVVSPRIYVDADACPVKPEIFRVAQRYDVAVTLVAASWMRVGTEARITLEVVGDRFDAADDWIAERVTRDDLVITADILLAARCIAAGARVLSPTGRPFTEANIGDVLATRNLLSELRAGGMETGGPAPFAARDRSRFLQALDHALQAQRRG
jgi:uncharacterized protein YaiI (UPF0178 family)